MKRAFGKFVLKTVLACLIMTVTAYVVFAAFVGSGVQEYYRDAARIILGVSATVSVFCITLGGLPFLLSFSRQGVKPLPWSPLVQWSEVSSVRWVGLRISRQLDRLILEGPLNPVDIPLYIFEEPDAAIAQLQNYLAWAGRLERNASAVSTNAKEQDD